MSDNGKPTQCLTCTRTTALRANGEILQRLIAPVLRAAPRASSEEQSAAMRDSASTWQGDIVACLKREMAHHPKCAGCGILMGPGHLEVGTDGQCRSCLGRCAIGQKSGGYANPSGPKVGRRGWHSDYAIKQ